MVESAVKTSWRGVPGTGTVVLVVTSERRGSVSAGAVHDAEGAAVDARDGWPLCGVDSAGAVPAGELSSPRP